MEHSPPAVDDLRRRQYRVPGRIERWRVCEVVIGEFVDSRPLTHCSDQCVTPVDRTFAVLGDETAA